MSRCFAAFVPFACLCLCCGRGFVCSTSFLVVFARVSCFGICLLMLSRQVGGCCRRNGLACRVVLLRVFLLFACACVGRGIVCASYLLVVAVKHVVEVFITSCTRACRDVFVNALTLLAEM